MTFIGHGAAVSFKLEGKGVQSPKVEVFKINLQERRECPGLLADNLRRAKVAAEMNS